MNTDIKLYTISEVAEIFRVTRSTVQSWTDAGKLKYIRIPSGKRRITQSEVDRFLAGETTGTAHITARKRKLPKAVIEGMKRHGLTIGGD